MMRRDCSSFPTYRWTNGREIVRKFKGDDYKKKRTFVVGVSDEGEDKLGDLNVVLGKPPRVLGSQ
jgi:hypothetical protein